MVNVLMVQGGAIESSGEISIHLVLPVLSKDGRQESGTGGLYYEDSLWDGAGTALGALPPL